MRHCADQQEDGCSQGRLYGASKWWCLENTSMVEGENGNWKLEDHEIEGGDGI